MRIVPTDYGHPDVTAMVDAVQLEYDRLYHDGGDVSPIDRADFLAPDGWFAVGYLRSEPVAMGGWRRRPAGQLIPGSAPAEIKRMYVVPAARGQGLARRMLAALEESAASAGVDFLALETGLAQPQAIGLYRRCGYTGAPAFGHYADEPDSVHLGKALASRSLAG